MPTIPIRVGDQQPINLPVIQNGTGVDVDEQSVKDTVRRRCEKDMRTAIDEREHEYRETRKTVKAIEAERIEKIKEANAHHAKTRQDTQTRIEAYRRNEMAKLAPLRSVADGKVKAINAEYANRIAVAEQSLAPAVTKRDADIENIREETAALIVVETEKALVACRTALAALTAKAEAMVPVTGGESKGEPVVAEAVPTQA